MDASTDVAVVLLVGTVVGLVAGSLGLGAGLSLPLLALLGLPLPQALLASKLPVAANDLATFGSLAHHSRAPVSGPQPSDWAALIAGALAAGVVMMIPSAALGVFVATLLLGVAVAGRLTGPVAMATACGAYIGGFGVAAGWLLRQTPLQNGPQAGWLSLRARRVAACANLGAVAALAGSGALPDAMVVWLALGQSLGGWLAGRRARWQQVKAHNSCP
jgi:hypothetical protein